MVARFCFYLLLKKEVKVEKLKIKNDTFKIAKRVRKINKNYSLNFNKSKQWFEVFFKEYGKERLELVLPFGELDFRTLEHIQKTSIANYKKLIEEMEKTNLKIEKDTKNKALDEADIKLKQMSKYLMSKGDNSSINFEDSYKTKWV